MFQSVILCTVSLVVTSSFRVHSCVDQVPQLPTSAASHDDRHDGYGCSGSRPSSCVVRAWFVNQDCWWNLILEAECLTLALEKLTTDWYVMRESVETVHSTVNRLVFSRAMKTIGSFAVKRSEKFAVHLTVGTERDGDS